MYTLSNGNKISVAFFDFDDTLAIHNNWDNMEKENRERFYRLALNHPDTFYEVYEPCIAPKETVDFVTKLANNDVKLYCLSGMRCCLNAEAKKAFLLKHYGPVFEFLSSSSQEAKQLVLNVLCPVPSEALLVDDYIDNLKRAKAKGFNCFAPDLKEYI